MSWSYPGGPRNNNKGGTLISVFSVLSHSVAQIIAGFALITRAEASGLLSQSVEREQKKCKLGVGGWRLSKSEQEEGEEEEEEALDAGGVG